MGFFNIPAPKGGGQGASTPGGNSGGGAVPGSNNGSTPKVNIPVTMKLGPKSMTAAGFAPVAKIASSSFDLISKLRKK
jgi:hypothetical protein